LAVNGLTPYLKRYDKSMNVFINKFINKIETTIALIKIPQN